jgi:two-component system, NtrC family, sensor histidine kinase KinB
MLRTRLTLGLMLLLIILLAMGIYSIDKCSDLGKRIQAISRDNDATGRILGQMKHSSALMTGALLTNLTGNLARSQADFASASHAFEDALREEQQRSGQDADETALVRKLAAAFHLYEDKASTFLKNPDRSDAAIHATATQLGIDTTTILDLLDHLTMAHEQARTAQGRDTAADINKTVDLLMLLMLVALVAFIMAWVGFSRGLLDPLRLLTSSIRQVGEGNLDQIVPVLDNDELGTLAKSFNRMATQLKEYRANTSVELMRLNMTIRATLASFPDPIFVLNSQGAVEFRNPEADDLAVKLLFSGVIRLPQQVEDKVEQVRARGQDYLPTLFKDAIKFHLDGQDRYFLPRIVLLRDEQRVTFGVAVILEDVTRMLLLDDVKSNLISTVSHELKTPLTSVRMALYLLFEKTVGALNEKQMDLVTTAREDADRLLRTLNDLLDLAKLEQGPSQLELALRAPGELAEMAIHATRDVAHAAGITLQSEIAPGLPEVEVDSQRIAYVFSNLITNAIKYSPAGTPIVIQVRKGRNRAGKPSVRFSVRDQGAGISPEHQEHIFERFYRIPGTPQGGAGLGLSIAREIVVAHRGEMGVISTPGQGSEFFFVLPFASDASVRTATDDDPARAKSSEGKANP